MTDLTKSSPIMFCRGTQSQVDDPDTGFALRDGQIIFTTDTRRIYFDHFADPDAALIRELVSGKEPVIATESQAGLVKPGTGLSIDGDGTLSVTDTGGIDEAKAFAISLIV